MRIATARQIAAIDAAAEKAGLPAHDLVEPAGKALADVILRTLRRMGKTGAAFFCGPGKNGADGFVAARCLLAEGFRAVCFLPGGRASLAPACDAKRALFEAAGGKCEDGVVPGTLSGFDLLVDALFGTGLSRDVTGVYALAIQCMMLAKLPILAVDLPSGLDTDTGRVRGCAVKADVTVTFTLPKPAHELASDYTGCVETVDFGIPEAVIAAEGPFACRFGEEEAAKLLPPRDQLTHKGGYGKAVLFVGGRGYAGAASLAAGAAVRSGCGLVWAMVPSCVYPICAGAVREAITLPLLDNSDGAFAYPALQDERMLQACEAADAFAIGSGVIPGPAAKKLLSMLLATGKKLVIDAGALHFLAGGNKDGKGEHIHFEDERLHENVILTPHRGELLRMMGGSLPGEADEFALARRLSAESGTVIVLKGHRSVIAAPDGRVAMNTTGNAGMAKGGSGDVLAGVIAGLAARMDAFEAAALGVWLAGRAGDLARDALGENGMTPGDTLQYLPAAAKNLGKG